MLFLTALIWGVAFVAQSVGMDYIGPFSFNAIRFFIGSVSLIPLILIMHKTGKAAAFTEKRRRDTIKGGIVCGSVLCVASLFQQYGVMYTTVGKAGFVTALYIIIVPFLSVFLHQKIGLKAWLAAVIAIIGFYLMCMTDGFSVSLGDGLVLVGALFWSVHILVIDYYAPKADCIIMSSIQFLFSGIVCGILTVIFEKVTWNDIRACAVPLLYAGIMSCGVAYTLQIVGQQKVKPTLACLILSLESVFSALAGWILLGEKMRAIEIFGCVLVFIGVILAQLPGKNDAADA